jgi:hypothetical protein
VIEETTGFGFGNLFFYSDSSAQSVKVADCKRWAIVYPEQNVGVVKEFVNALSSVSPSLGTLIGREGLLVHVHEIFCVCKKCVPVRVVDRDPDWICGSGLGIWLGIQGKGKKKLEKLNLKKLFCLNFSFNAHSLYK